MLLAATLLVATPAAGQPPPAWRASITPGTYRLDGQRSGLTARMRFLGLRRYDLRFIKLRGHLRDDGGPSPEVEIEVDPKAVAKSGDMAARQAIALLEPDRYPVVRFVGRQLSTTGETGTLEGDLTMHGVTRPVRFTVTLKAARSEAGGAARVAFAGSGHIQRSQFSMTAMRSLASDRIDLIFDVAFVRTGPP